MVTPAQLFDAFGGSVTKVARACGVPVSTAKSWQVKGSIPAWRQEAARAALEDARQIA